MQTRESDVVAVLTDDGVGAEFLDAGAGHLGMATMRARATTEGGDLQIDSSPEKARSFDSPCPGSTGADLSFFSASTVCRAGQLSSAAIAGNRIDGSPATTGPDYPRRVTNVEIDPAEVVCSSHPGVGAVTSLEILEPREVPLGGLRAMSVRRTLPQKSRSLVGAWCFADHYGPRMSLRPAA